MERLKNIAGDVMFGVVALFVGQLVLSGLIALVLFVFTGGRP